MTPLFNGLGYVDLVSSSGTDAGIVAAARMSTDGAFRGWGTDDKPGDEKLLRYLWKHGHHSPFEMTHVALEIQAPIFVARQIFRHRLFSFNELSARYTHLPDSAWLPAAEEVRLQNITGNKQGSEPTSTLNGDHFIAKVEESYRQSFRVYEELCAAGYAREQARTVMPLGTMTRWRQGGNLRCWLDFLSKRLPANAQAETRQVATACAEMIEPLFPRTFALFQEGVR